MSPKLNNIAEKSADELPTILLEEELCIRLSLTNVGIIIFIDIEGHSNLYCSKE